MATTHVFIVDTITLKYHIEYLFAGTGAKDYVIDFNNSKNSSLNPQRENLLVSMISDLERIRVNDFIIFYLQQSIRSEVYNGKFYGIFQVRKTPFLDNNDEQQFLKEVLNKNLTFRVLLKPYKVYAKGVTEWESLDEIKNITSPCQMLWSLIYRKLKGNRGNTMITIYESERLINLIKEKNNHQEVSACYFSFNIRSQEIVPNNIENKYTGREYSINILKRLIQKYDQNKAFESHLQAYIIQNIGKGINISLDKLILQENRNNIEWIGNEISCGVGMQRIDIGISLKMSEQERIFIPIELKAIEINLHAIDQMKRYIDWLRQYYIPNRISEIKPILIGKKQTKIDNKNIINKAMKKFKKEKNLDLSIIEYVIQNQELIFCQYTY